MAEENSEMSIWPSNIILVGIPSWLGWLGYVLTVSESAPPHPRHGGYLRVWLFDLMGERGDGQHALRRVQAGLTPCLEPTVV